MQSINTKLKKVFKSMRHQYKKKNQNPQYDPMNTYPFFSSSFCFLTKGEMALYRDSMAELNSWVCWSDFD